MITMLVKTWDILFPYGQPECHGALIKVTPDNYEKIKRSEGVGEGIESIIILPTILTRSSDSVYTEVSTIHGD
jgi:hypothetical protein